MMDKKLSEKCIQSLGTFVVLSDHMGGLSKVTPEFMLHVPTT